MRNWIFCSILFWCPFWSALLRRQTSAHQIGESFPPICREFLQTEAIYLPKHSHQSGVLSFNFFISKSKHLNNFLKIKNAKKITRNYMKLYENLFMSYPILNLSQSESDIRSRMKNYTNPFYSYSKRSMA